jgi:glycosyltransferase involved in cell wall biosynthesis
VTKIAFVTPWFGPDIPGGSEAEARRTAQHLHEAGFEVEVLTTCIKDFYGDWGKNYHRPGVEQVNGLPVRRFPVLPRDKAAFDQVNWRLMNGLPITAEQEQTFINEMICVPTLYDFMRQNAASYLFIFIPYMFATTYWGAQVCPQHSLVIPCLHDESYAHLKIFKEVLPQVKAMAFFVEAEQAVAHRLYTSGPQQMRQVVGAGVDVDFTADSHRFRQKYQLNHPFLLYVGRREMGKNTPLLLQYWQQYRCQTARELKLVLIGPGQINVPPDADVLDLGFVPVQDKYDAYAAADIFCMPSINESFSIATMESWLTGTPVLVHGHCAVTHEHCVKSNGGLYFTNYDEFAATVDFLLDNPHLAQQMGKNGRQYVLDNFQWPTVIAKYKQLIVTIEAELS